MATVKVQWEGNMNFRGYDSDNREVMMDAAQVYGGLDQGIRPMQLMLISLGGCTAIEVGHVLNKMRLPYDKLNVEVSGERAETIPKVFTSIKIKYIFKGESLTTQKIEKAIKLGASVYCSAANMIKQACPIDYEYELNGTLYKYVENTDNVGESN